MPVCWELWTERSLPIIRIITFFERQQEGCCDSIKKKKGRWPKTTSGRRPSEKNKNTTIVGFAIQHRDEFITCAQPGSNGIGHPASFQIAASSLILLTSVGSGSSCWWKIRRFRSSQSSQQISIASACVPLLRVVSVSWGVSSCSHSWSVASTLH